MKRGNFKKVRGNAIVALAVVMILFSGCSPFALIPVTLREVKNYVVAQEQSFSYPLDRVMGATTHSLSQTGFTLSRIEHFNRKGLILAHWEEMSVKLSLESITPGLTKISSRLYRDKTAREFSSEKEIFSHVREILQSERPFHWKEIVRGMVMVHVSPDEKSPVVAYLGPGENADLIDEEGSWGRIALMGDGTGFMKLIHLGPPKSPGYANTVEDESDEHALN